MSAANQLTPWFWMHRPVRLPHQVVDALINNEITALQFCILVMLHRRAEWKTGIVLSFSAEQVIYDLGDSGLIPDGTTAVRRRYVRRDMQSLREHGWYHNDYKEGSKRPYNSTLHNYSAKCMVCVHLLPCHDKMYACDHEQEILNPSEVTPCNRAHRKVDHEKDNACDHVVTPSNTASGSNAAEASHTTPCSPPEAVTLPTGSSLIDLQDSPVVRVPPSVESQDKTTNQDAAFGVGGHGKISDVTQGHVRALRNEINQIALDVMHSTAAFPRWLLGKLPPVIAKHGADAIAQDFRVWCEEHQTNRVEYPISEYFKVLESRLDPAHALLPLAASDPQVAELQAFSHEQTGHLTPLPDCTRLLQTDSLKDIKTALNYYCEVSSNRSQKYIAAFYVDGGVKAILQTIRTREREAEEAQAKQAAWKLQAKLKADARELQCKQEEAKRLEAAECAQKERLVKQAAVNEQREVECIAYQRDFQLRADFRAVWDDSSIDLYDWCASHPFADGTLLDDKIYGEALTYRLRLSERHQEAIEFLKTALQDGESHLAADVYAAAGAAGIENHFVDNAFKVLRCVECERAMTIFGAQKEWQLPTGGVKCLTD